MEGQADAVRGGGRELRVRWSPIGVLVDAIRSVRAATRTAVFFLKLFPRWH